MPLSKFLYFQNYLILESKWKSDSVQINIINQTVEFTGSISYELFKNISQCLEIEYEFFFDETKKSISTNNGLPEFKYLIKENEFIWQKCCGENRKVTFGKMKLSETPSEGIQFKVLSNTVDIVSNLKFQLIEKNKEIKKLMEQEKKSKKQLEMAITSKEENEKELFKKFISLLNSKKNKIKELQNDQKQCLDSSDEENEITVIESVTRSSHSSATDLGEIPCLPKRTKFQPVKTVQPEKIPELISSQSTEPDSEDIFAKM